MIIDKNYAEAVRDALPHDAFSDRDVFDDFTARFVRSGYQDEIAHLGRSIFGPDYEVCYPEKDGSDHDSALPK